MSKDRVTSNPGGCECVTCGAIFIGGPDHDECGRCHNTLEPCPFCGSPAEIITLEGEDGDVGVGAQCVQCTSGSCGASSGLIYPLMDDVTDLLRERWNSRKGDKP